MDSKIVFERDHCKFFAVQMVVSGFGLGPEGGYRYEAGDWLLFLKPPKIGTDLYERIDTAARVVSKAELNKNYSWE